MQELRDVTGIQSFTSMKVSDVMLPTFSFPFSSNFWRQGTRTTTGTSTLFTAAANKDTYISHIHMAYGKNATSDGIEATLILRQGGRDIEFPIRGLTLTAANNVYSTPINPPIKIDRSSDVDIALSFTVGAETLHATVGGFVI